MRTTQKHIDAKIDTINRMTGQPLTYMSKKDGKNIINVGHYHLDKAYGGQQLVQTMNDGGGITCPCGYGRHTKSQMAAILDAFIAGLSAERKG